MTEMSVLILENALYSLRPFERICVYSFNTRNRQRIYEEFYNREGDFVSFRSTDTPNGDFLEDHEQIGRIINSSFMIIKIIKVYISGTRRTIFDHRIPQTRINTPRRPRRN